MNDQERLWYVFTTLLGETVYPESESSVWADTAFYILRDNHKITFLFMGNGRLADIIVSDVTNERQAEIN